MPQCQSPFLELMFLISKNILQDPGNRWPKALPKLCQNSGFFVHISPLQFCPCTGKYWSGKTRILAYFTQCRI